MRYMLLLGIRSGLGVRASPNPRTIDPLCVRWQELDTALIAAYSTYCLPWVQSAKLQDYPSSTLILLPHRANSKLRFIHAFRGSLQGYRSTSGGSLNHRYSTGVREQKQKGTIPTNLNHVWFHLYHKKVIKWCQAAVPKDCNYSNSARQILAEV